MFCCKSSFFFTARSGFVAVTDCLFNISAATLHTGDHSSIRNLRTPHALVTDPLITDHQLNIQQIYVYVFCMDLRTNSDYFTVQH